VRTIKVIVIIICALLVWSGSISLAFDEPNKIEYELRERCGKRAEQVWHRDYGSQFVKNDDGGYATYHYSNHYNGKLNKCFFLVWEEEHSPKDHTIRMETLVDVDEHDQYGFMMFSNGQFYSCDVKGGSCNSEREWMEFRQRYMEE